MGDTEKGSWTSRELGRHINKERARVKRVGHTPGPWEVGPYNNVHDTDTGESVAVVTDRHGEEANARLIAAAPELLAALQAVKVEWDAYNGSKENAGTFIMYLASCWDEVESAIAKATGGTDASR